MELKNRFMVRVQVKEDDKFVKKTWIQEARIQKDVYEIIQNKYRFHNDIDWEDNIEGVLGVRLMEEE
jgi:hypothetical protein